VKTLFNVVNVILKFKSHEGEPKKFLEIMLNRKLSIIYAFGTKKLKNKQKLQLVSTYENMVKF
jgi:hypothetical protein